MNMDKAEESLNNYFDKVQSLVEANRQFQDNKDDIEQLAEILGEELKLSRENEERLRDEIKTLLETCNSFSSLNFIDLKENVTKLQEENKKLKTEIADLKELFNVEKTSLKHLHEKNIQQLTDKHNEATQKVTDEMQLTKEECEQQKQQLYTEIQLLQAQAAMQCDTVETKYFSQISDLNNKLRQVNLFNTSLRSEIQNMKTQYGILLNDKEQVIFELENKLKNAETALLDSRVQFGQQSGQNNINTNMQELSSNDESSNLGNFCNIETGFDTVNHTASASTTFSKAKAKAPYTTAGLNAKGFGDKNKFKAETHTKYRPLEVTRRLPKFSDDTAQPQDLEDFEINQFVSPARMHMSKAYNGGSGNANRSVRPNVSSYLPPLKQCSNAKEGRTAKTAAPKKRKLYNPDDLDYLDTLDGPD